jgi:hypothetical protein
MQPIKKISERNKIDTQSRADTYIRRKRLIIKNGYNLKSGCTLLGRVVRRCGLAFKTPHKTKNYIVLKSYTCNCDGNIWLHIYSFRNSSLMHEQNEELTPVTKGNCWP